MTELKPLKPDVSFEDFEKIDLRVVKILDATPVPKTDRLMLLTIDLGLEQRQIVAGIQLHYKPEQLIGKSIVIIANLAPKEIKKILSHGMCLAGSFEVENQPALSLVIPLIENTSPGTALS